MSMENEEEMYLDFRQVVPVDKYGVSQQMKLKKPAQWMEPPWEVFEMPQTSMGWRMGGGEDYLHEWNEWFEHLSQEKQQAYIAQYPEPEDWFHFYPQNSPQNKEEFYARLEQTRRLRTTYCELQCQLSMLHEEAGHDEQAVDHLGKVIFNIMTFQVWDDEKSTEVVERYVVLKRRLTQQMKWRPTVRESWNALRQSEHRTRVEPRQTIVTPADYGRMQREIFFPSDIGQTWTKYFEDDTLYIHRHWQEPCVFLVILQQEKQAYRIAEAWMNLDPAIPRPLTRPSRRPSVLLTWLLGRFVK